MPFSSFPRNDGGVTSLKRYPPCLLATVVLPWDVSYELDRAQFTATVRHLKANLTAHLYLFGTAGEGYAVTEQQYDEAVESFLMEMLPGSSPMIGVISLSLGTVVERIERARQRGAREFQLSLPAWGTLTDREVDSFFAETCGRFGDCRFIHYNLARAKRVLTGRDYARLAAAHPNLVGIKMGGENLEAMVEILEAAPQLQCFFTDFAYAALRDKFECGLLAALVSMNPRRAREYHAARGGELARMRDELRFIHSALKVAVGDSAHMDGAYDKLYVKMQDPRFPLRLLPPYQSTTDDVFSRFRAAIPPAWQP